jgi:predicted DNA-binding transcriptional regulator YafY
MRNREVIRQWTLLRTLDAHRHGATVDDLARELEVTKRTIWRDMEALQAVGFPLMSELDGKRTRWKLAATPFKGLADLGVSMVELCSLYMAREMVGGMAGGPFGTALGSITKKLEKALSPKMREFLDRLPELVEAKVGAVKKPAIEKYSEHLALLLEACAEQRTCSMRYFSASSGMAKSYIVHPYRLAHADGGMYLLTWVPAYGEIRTFAVERIQKLSRQDERFKIQEELSGEAFAHSLGVNRGTAEKVVVRFSARIAPYVRERSWHKSQKVQDLPGGDVRMTLDVCTDAALRTWILGFGALAKVESPSWLAAEILEQLDEAREAYVPRLDIALPHRIFSPGHPRLPGIGSSRPS